MKKNKLMACIMSAVCAMEITTAGIETASAFDVGGVIGVVL